MNNILAAPILEVEDDAESCISPNMQQIKFYRQQRREEEVSGYDDCVAQEESINDVVGEEVAKPAATGPGLVLHRQISKDELDPLGLALKASLEHLRINTIVSSDQDSEEDEDEGGNFIVNGQIVDLGTMEAGSIAN